MAENNSLIAQKVREARLENGLTQQDIADKLGRTSAAISDLERGKIQITASDLFEISTLLNRPIEYFFGLSSDDKDIQEVISIIRKMSPESRKNHLTNITMILKMFKIGDNINSISDENELLDLAKNFYNLFLPFSVAMNKLISDMQNIRKYLDSLLGINSAK